MWLTAAVIAVLTAGAVVVLWWPATAGLNGAELVSARLDALKIGLSIGLGSGGVVALYLSWRRQESTERALAHQQEVHAATMAHQDRVARATEYDAAERRLSELYLKAVEQLGSPEAAVRHGGLYALERVAQSNPEQRQTVVNVICAYLRSPYTPPPETSGSHPLGVRRPLLRSATAIRSAPTPSRDGGREALLMEREVRLTAQGILHLHLHPGPDSEHPLPGFWHDIDLELTGATLINFSLHGCVVATATFDGATFTGDAWFRGATFTRDAWFVGATFTDNTRFDQATFNGVTRFDQATFTRDAMFDGARFTSVGSAWFGGATFIGNTRFDGATFTGNAWFVLATFTRAVSFSAAKFISGASFNEAIYNGRPFDPGEHGVPDDDESAPG